MSIVRSVCGPRPTFSFYTSCKNNEFFEINVKFVYGLRAIGKGSQSGKTLFAILYLPNPPVRFERYNPLLLRSLNKMAIESMLQATQEAVSHNIDDNGESTRDISVGLDGTWQRSILH